MLEAAEPTSRPQIAPVDKKERRFPVFLKFFVPLLLLAGAWSIATPIDGSPDEHRHIIYAYALATGQVDPSSTTYTVPDRLGLNRSACYAFAPENSAACDRFNEGVGVVEEIVTSTSANNYPRLYYRLAGWPLKAFPNDLGIYAARLLGATFSCLFMALALVNARVKRLPWLTMGVFLSITPMVLFLVGSFNPQGLELAGSLAFIAAALALSRGEGQREDLLPKATLLLAIPPLVLSRPNGFIWPFALGALVMFAARTSPAGAIRRWGSRYVLVFSAVVVISVILAGWWQVARGSRDTGAGVIGPPADVFPRSIGALLQVLTTSQTFPGDWIGTFGWLDTRLSSATLAIWFGLLGGLVLFGLVFHRGRDLTVAASSLVAAVVFSLIVDLYYRSTLGVTVAQGRYVLPFVMLAICLVCLNLSSIESIQQRLPGLIGMGWWLGSVAAFVEALRRYVVGVNLRSPSGYWEPPLPPATAVALVGVGAILLAYACTKRASS